MSAEPVICLVRDLLFMSKLRSAAATAAIPLVCLRDPAQLPDRQGRLLVVDLNQPGAIPAAAGWRSTTGRPVVGFVSHVDADTAAAARAAGIDRVMARSRFVEELATLLMPAKP